MKKPALSVAMSVYNGASHLALAIESILNQTVPDFEFLILNDGSNDDSAQIIDHYAASDSRIRAIHRENRGLIQSLNELVDQARAPLIARMDCDDISLPNRFEKQLAFMAAHPEYGVVGTWSDDIDEFGAPCAIKGNDHATTHQAFLENIDEGPLVCHPSVMMKRADVLAVGGYHQAFQHCEDYDLWLRLAGVTQICSLPERLIKYRHWSNQVSSRYAYLQQTGAAIAYFAYLERLAGRPDPTENLITLPPLDQLDALFGRNGIANQVCARVVPTLVYSEVALKSQGYDLVMHYVRQGGRARGLWRTVARLTRIGEPRRAAGLARALMQR